MRSSIQIVQATSHLKGTPNISQRVCVRRQKTTLAFFKSKVAEKVIDAFMVLDIKNFGNVWARLVCFQRKVVKKLILTVVWTDNCDRTFLRLNSVEFIGVCMSTMIAFVVNVDLM